MKTPIPIQELTAYTHITSGSAEVLAGQLLRQTPIRQQQELEAAIDACLQSLRHFVDLLHETPPDQIPADLAARLLSTVTRTLLPRMDETLEKLEQGAFADHKTLEELYRLTDEVSDYFETLELANDQEIRQALRQAIATIDVSSPETSRHWRDLLSSL
ncbi:MAG: hypothetical protein HY347_04350 [candidate division NC10 bacterium]|nr:hypothetical protein [candidate division NC10 bacterium]